MNLLIGIVIVLCLVVCEFSSPQPVADVWVHVMAMLFTAALVPAMAAFQTFVVTRRIRVAEVDYETRQGILRRLSAAHSAVWLAASLAIVYAIQWQNVVRDNWQLDRWPLLDEVIIILPILLSLIASWAIFYEIQRSVNSSSEHLGTEQAGNSMNSISRFWNSERFNYVSIRIRVYLGLLLVPIVLMVLLRDLEVHWETLSPWYQIGLFVMMTAGLLAVFPLIMLLIWNGGKFDDPELQQTLKNDCREHRLHVMDVRMWKTNSQIMNAMVAGVFPGMRIIMLSDGLIKRFSRSELRAILRHEAGHIRCGHLPIRMGFVMLLALFCGAWEVSRFSMLSNIESTLTVGLGSWSDIFGITAFVLMLGATSVTLLSWLSRNMEFEADLYSASNEGEIDKEKASAMLDALLRLGSYAPDQIDRKSLMHPSIRQRIDSLTTALVDANFSGDFRRRFRKRVATLGLAILGLAMFVAWL